MFCHCCGAKLEDGSALCGCCGAILQDSDAGAGDERSRTQNSERASRAPAKPDPPVVPCWRVACNLLMGLVGVIIFLPLGVFLFAEACKCAMARWKGDRVRADELSKNVLFEFWETIKYAIVVWWLLGGLILVAARANP